MGIDVQHDLVGAGGGRGDQRTLDHLVRRVLKQEAVLERPRLVFVAIADDVLVASRRGSHRRPFSMRRETSAAHPAQVGLLDLGNDRGRFAQGPGQPFSAAACQPGIQVGANPDVLVEQNLIELFHRALRAPLTGCRRPPGPTRRSATLRRRADRNSRSRGTAAVP
ncbi:hypothetical protein D9M72_314430 [compost metagenome]